MCTHKQPPAPSWPVERAERYGKTNRKHVTLTQEAVDHVQAYAEQHGLHFSVALETLALLGLGRQTAETLPRLVSNMLERTVAHQFNRFAKLTAEAVMASEEANSKADFLILQAIWREARQDPTGFAEKLVVSLDPTSQPAAAVRQIVADLKQISQSQGVDRLKKKTNVTRLTIDKEAASDD